MRTGVASAVAFALTCGGCAGAPPSGSASDGAALQQQVFAVERAFARTMAERDFAAFGRFVATDAIFFSGPTPLRGKAAVLARWKRFFEPKEAPFRWEPAQVEVLESGTLALSTGPVFDPAGTRIAKFTSVWRLDAPGTWHIVLDKGEDACDCATR